MKFNKRLTVQEMRDTISLVCGPTIQRPKRCHSPEDLETKNRARIQYDLRRNLKQAFYKHLITSSFLKREPRFGNKKQYSLEDLAALAFGPKIDFPDNPGSEDQANAIFDQKLFQYHLQKDPDLMTVLKEYHN